MKPLREISSDFEHQGHRVLFMALMTILLVNPFLQQYDGLKWLLSIMLMLVLLAAVRTISSRARQYRIAIALGFLAVIPQLGLMFTYTGWLELLRLTATPLFLFWVCTLLLHDIILRSHAVTAELIMGAINIYLMVGIAFAFVYGLTEYLQPSSFLGLSEIESGPNNVLPYLYFSFITLSTLGYGDITPLTSFGMTVTFLEAVFGQLYLAILVARLVGLYITRQSGNR